MIWVQLCLKLWMVGVKSLPGTDYIVSEQVARGMFILSHCRRITELKWMQGLVFADSKYFTGMFRAQMIYIPLNPLGMVLLSTNHWLVSQWLLFGPIFFLLASCQAQLFQLSLWLYMLLQSCILDFPFWDHCVYITIVTLPPQTPFTVWQRPSSLSSFL